MKIQMPFTIGSDPEVMIYNRSLGKIVSSLALLPDKQNPIDLNDGIFVYADNVLVEAKFPPVRTKAEFVNSFRKAFFRIKRHLGDNFKIIPVAAHVYDDSELQDRAAWKIGCVPSYNCYTQDENEIVKFNDGMRTGSAHIHIGNPNLCNYNRRHETTRLLDVFVGCASVILEQDIAEASRARRNFYGKAGEFRPTPYGLEYRVLSPFVLSSPALIELIYDLVDFTLSIVEGGESEQILNLVNGNQVQDCINNCESRLAEMILTNIREASEMPRQLLQRIGQSYNVRNFDSNWNLR